MRPKQKHTKLTDAQAVEIVKLYHLGRLTQAVIAERYGIDTGYVSRLVNGESRPEAYETVRSEIAAETPTDDGA